MLTLASSAKDDAIRDLDLHVGFWSVVKFSFPAERKNVLRIMFKRAPLSTMYIMSFDFLIGFGLGVVASSIGETPLKKSVFLRTSA